MMPLSLGLGLGLVHGGAANVHDGLVADFISRRFYTRSAGGALTTYANAQDMFSWSSSSVYTRNASGIWVPSGTNTPAYEWNTSGNPLGVRIQGSRQNVIKKSANISDSAYWSGVSGYSPTAMTSCFSGQTAYRLTGIGGGSQAFVQNIGTPGAVAGTLSIIIEQGTATQTSIAIYSNTGGAFVAFCRYVWSTDSFTVAIGSASNLTVEQLGTGPNGGKMVRLSFNCTPTAGHSCDAYVYWGDSLAHSLSATIHHVQHEAGVGASSPIVTDTSALTRNKDVVQRVFGSEWDTTKYIVNTEFFVGRTDGRDYAGGTSQSVVSLADALSAGDDWSLIYAGARLDFTERKNGVGGASGNNGSMTFNATRKAAFGWADGIAFGSVDGASVTLTGTPSSSPNELTRMILGAWLGSNPDAVSIYLRKIETYPETPTQARVNALTA